MSAENLGIVHRWFDEVWNQRRAETIDELLTPDSVCYTDEGPIRGPGGFKERQYVPMLSAFPDIRVDVEATIVQGDQVVVRWTASGTHAGEGLGCPATQRPVTMRGMTWLVVRDGKLVEGWQTSNITDIVRELASA